MTSPLLTLSLVEDEADDARGCRPPEAEVADADFPPRVPAADDEVGGGGEPALSMRTPAPSG